MASPPGEPTSSPADQGEPIAGAATAQPDRTSESRPKGVFPPPRKLTDEQEREVKRLYAETSTPLGEIARRFGISQTSVARVAQRQGATLRLRRDTPPGGSQPTAPTSARPRRRAAPAAELEPTPVATRRRRGGPPAGSQVAPPREPGASAPSAAPQASGGGVQQRFRVRFVAEQVIEAGHMREVIERVEALGATEITSIARED